MLSQAIPSTVPRSEPVGRGGAFAPAFGRSGAACAPTRGSGGLTTAGGSTGARGVHEAHGPLPVPFHQPPRCQGPGLGAGAVPGGAGAGRVRGAVRASG